MSILDELIGKVIDEKYLVEHQLGQGGMGAVYKATHLGTKRPMAVKVISPQFMAKEEFIERFRREAEAAGRLRHPNVVNVTDFGSTKIGKYRIAYLVMEYLDGLSLGRMLREQTSLMPLPLIIDIVERAALAIDHAHRQGIIHRDLKPDNIWLEPDGRGSYNVKVLDFGLAKLRDPESLDVEELIDNSPYFYKQAPLSPNPSTKIQKVELTALTVSSNVDPEAPTAIHFKSDPNTETPAKNKSFQNTIPSPDNSSSQVELTQIGTVIGTPLYMSPEQCAGKKVSSRSDIYSLGVITYHMIAGEPPFTGTTTSLVEKHINSKPPSLKDKRAKLPEGIEEVVMQALEKEPNKRSPTAEALASSLRIEGECDKEILQVTYTISRQIFPLLFKIALASYLPFLLLTTFLFFLLSPTESLQSRAIHYLHSLMWMIVLVAISLGNLFCLAMLSIFFEQKRVAPFEKLSLPKLVSATYQKASELIYTEFFVYKEIVLGLFKLLLPAVEAYKTTSLVAAVVMLEGLKGRKAVNRSRILVNRLRFINENVQARNLLFNSLIILTPLFLLAIGGFSLDIFLAFKVGNFLAVFYSIIYTFLALVFFTRPFISISQVVLYYKARLIGGEITSQEVNKIFEYQEKLVQRSSMRIKTGLMASLPLVIILIITIFYTNPLLSAVSKGNLATIQNLITSSTNVNARTLFTKYTPLMEACEKGSLEIVDLLIRSGADVNLVNKDGNSALLIAAKQGYIDVVKKLVDAGAD
ncbi:MAG: protein kinase, partial [Blastocatellia bacterium]|nr:protein kinase [Blastocatellia bacterium]